MTISGSFSGTPHGNIISNISDVTANINGIAFNQSGNLEIYSWSDANSTWLAGGAYVSFDGKSPGAWWLRLTRRMTVAN
jgi:hypothetical protein